MRRRRHFADGELQAVLAAALHELEELLHSDDPRVKLKAAVVILDRTLGRPGQRLEHAGTLELRRADLLAQAKEELQHEYNAQAVSARAKLQQLLERRTQVN